MSGETKAEIITDASMIRGLVAIMLKPARWLEGQKFNPLLPEGVSASILFVLS